MNLVAAKPTVAQAGCGVAALGDEAGHDVRCLHQEAGDVVRTGIGRCDCRTYRDVIF